METAATRRKASGNVGNSILVRNYYDFSFIMVKKVYNGDRAESVNQQATDGTREWGIVLGGITGTPLNCSRYQ